MGYLETPEYKIYSREELKSIKPDMPDENIGKLVKAGWDRIAKPLDGLGVFEDLISRIGMISGSADIDIRKKAVIIMCADNGIVDEGVSQCGREVTLAVARSMGEAGTSVGKMAAYVQADTIPVDIGIDTSEKIEGVLDRKVRRGTRNFATEPAMTDEETLKAISVGIDMVRICRDLGYRLIATGEMGIGNTTTSSAVASALLKINPDDITGRGAGLDDDGLSRKRTVIKKSIDKYGLYEKTPFEILRTVGGLDIAGLAGVCIGGALYHIPIVLDGVISMVSALVAERLVPGVKYYLIPSHKGKEPAVNILSDALSLNPVIEGRMALGEGTGAVMMFALLDMAMCIYNDRTSFEDIEIEEYKRF